MNQFLIKMVDLYKYFVSPALYSLGGRCRFHPTCSEYADHALRKYSCVKAAKLIFLRLAKCGPWNEGGIDYVK